MIEISDEVRLAFHNLGKLHAESHKKPDCGIAACKIADFARDQLAARLNAEFWRYHEESLNVVGGKGQVYCSECSPNLDARHNWELADWQREAWRLLSGEKP